MDIKKILFASILTIRATTVSADIYNFNDYADTQASQLEALENNYQEAIDYNGFYGGYEETPTEGLQQNYQDQIQTMLQSDPNMNGQQEELDAQAVNQQTQILNRSLKQQEELNSED